MITNACSHYFNDICAYAEEEQNLQIGSAFCIEIWKFDEVKIKKSIFGQTMEESHQ